jgi:hypothetical protein
VQQQRCTASKWQDSCSWASGAMLPVVAALAVAAATADSAAVLPLRVLLLVLLLLLLLLLPPLLLLRGCGEWCSLLGCCNSRQQGVKLRNNQAPRMVRSGPWDGATRSLGWCRTASTVRRKEQASTAVRSCEDSASQLRAAVPLLAHLLSLSLGGEEAHCRA